MYSTFVNALLLALPVVVSAQGLLSAQSYTDPNTGMTLYGIVVDKGYRFGMVMPKKPTTDFIVQLVSPLKNGAGWGGVGFRANMRGTLLLITWPNGDKVMTSPRIATAYRSDGVVPYRVHPITLVPIQQGTFVNTTHISSTFLCRGCINADSFDPTWGNTRSVFFTYAYSMSPVENPGTADAAILHDHLSADGGYGAFSVELDSAKSDKYETYAALAKPGGGPGSSQATARPTRLHSTPLSASDVPSATGTSGCSGLRGSMLGGSNFSHGWMSPLIVMTLMILGVVYLAQAFQPN